MTTQPEALALAELFEIDADAESLYRQAAALLRTQHAEIEASDRNLCQLTDELIECRREIERKDALLRQALEFIEAMDEESCLLIDAITKELQ